MFIAAESNVTYLSNGSITNKFSRHNKINTVGHARATRDGALVTAAILSRLHCLLKYLLTIIDKALAREFSPR